MRIVIDLQSVQSCNKNRGIGRYSLSLAKAIVRNRGSHEVFLVLNNLFPESILPIRHEFKDLLPQENIRVWSAPGPVAAADAGNDWRRESAEYLREAFLASLEPDIVYVTSLFEGLSEDAVTSIARSYKSSPTAATLYDLIPLIHAEKYLDNPIHEAWYFGKLNSLRKADLLLAISESSRLEAIEYLNFSPNKVVNVGADADTCFYEKKVSIDVENDLRHRYKLTRPFVMYTGGIDHRKNIEGLIRGYACLPENIRDGHQLAIICSVDSQSRKVLEDLAKKHGLHKDDIAITGFVPETDLVDLYNTCRLFVFPSWHEGFGLPALEAMRCGAPVIGANTTSLPEVIGWDKALFDPYDDAEITRAIERGLCDEEYRSALIDNGLVQSKKFAWDNSAKKVISAFERVYADCRTVSWVTEIKRERPKLAYISPLPPDRSGIADYSAMLLPELSRYYEIYVIVPHREISDPLINGYCTVRPIDWLVRNPHRVDRILYHFGNSEFHEHMFALLEDVPGVVVLHDFFLSGIIAHMEFSGYNHTGWMKELYKSHGYSSCLDRFINSDIARIIYKYPVNLSVLQNAKGIIAHSSYSLDLAKQWYGQHDPSKWSVIPLIRSPKVDYGKREARFELGIDEDVFVVCSFGMLGPTKLNHKLIDAWMASELSSSDCCLIFVGQNHEGSYGQELLEKISVANKTTRINITGWTEAAVYRKYLAAADVGVQLRTLSRGETSAAVLDCMNYGIATVVNANGSMRDLSQEAVLKIDDEFTNVELTHALETLWKDEHLRNSIADKAREILLRDHEPKVCASKYYAAIEHNYSTSRFSVDQLIRSISKVEGEFDDTDLSRLATSISTSFQPSIYKRNFFVDISELVQRDSKTGIQRVVRAILSEWLRNPPDGFRIEPVYAEQDSRYRYARRFTCDFLGCPSLELQDEIIDYRIGDIFLGLDLQPQIVIAHKATYEDMRNHGVIVRFIVYDLLPVLFPSMFVEGAKAQHTAWLDIVAESDGAVCISKAVADDLENWIRSNRGSRGHRYHVDWFHLGADIESSVPTIGLPDNSNNVLSIMLSRPSFLMVGTIEPRKSHLQVLEAFNLLWRQKIDINLFIVGKQGWMVGDVIEQVCAHSEFGNRLFWFDAVSDEYLEELYAATSCLIAASVGEGFGLPLLEAAKRGLPIIARDIPVFREVAGPHASYFSGHNPEKLADSIKKWLDLKKTDSVPESKNIECLTWRESANNLMKKMLG